MKKNKKVEKLARVAKDNAFMLADLAAKGSEDAAVELYRTAALLTEWLEYVSGKKPELFCRIAETKFSWPVMYSPHRDWLKDTIESVKKLKLGARTNINLSSGKTFSWDVAANVVAFNLHQLAQDLQRAPISEWRDFRSIAACGVGRTSAKVHKYDARYEKQLRDLEAWGQRGKGKQLPLLSRATADQWATGTKELFRIAYPGDFEKHPNLQELRVSVLGRARTMYGEPGGAGIIRAAMLRAVKQAWSSIAVLD